MCLLLSFFEVCGLRQLNIYTKELLTGQSSSNCLPSRSVQGAQPRVRFNPPMLDMGPVLPHEPQGDSREVEIINEGPWDVEIFSLDFDKVRSQHIMHRKLSHKAFAKPIQSNQPSVSCTAQTRYCVKVAPPV